MKKDNSIEVFFSLLRAGLWEQGVRLLAYGPVDFEAVYMLAAEQSVVGLVAAGLEHVEDVEVPKQVAFSFMSMVLALEKKNRAMNCFIAELNKKLRDERICAVLVKGQGVAQCYERPLWRACGDVDLFLDAENYEKAKDYLSPLATSVEGEDKRRLHLGMTIGSWVVELHGTMYTGKSHRMDRGIDLVQRDVFEKEGVRVWSNSGVDVLLPNPDNDVIIVFTHFIGHFYGLGVGLRQICDWCRLLWRYRDVIDAGLLERRLREMGLIGEWKAFAAFAVSWLGMPVEAMPLYDGARRWVRKAQRICKLVIKTGNFGHNKDESYRSKYSRKVGLVITFFRRLGEFARIATIFPVNSPRFFVTYVLGRVKRG